MITKNNSLRGGKTVVSKTRITKCPYCGGDIITNTKNDRGYDDTPFRSCPKCFRTYFDGAYQEPGILAYEDNGGKIPFSLLILAGITTYGIVALIVAIIQDGWSSGLLLPLIFIGGLAILFDLTLLSRIICRLDNNKKHHQRQIDLIEGHRGTMSQKLKDSMGRLSSTSYLDSLKSHGVKVPAYFYKRLEKTFDEKLEEYFETDSEKENQQVAVSETESANGDDN